MGPGTAAVLRYIVPGFLRNIPRFVAAVSTFFVLMLGEVLERVGSCANGFVRTSNDDRFFASLMTRSWVSFGDSFV